MNYLGSLLKVLRVRTKLFAEYQALNSTQDSSGQEKLRWVLIAFRPSTFLNFHHAMVERKYRLLRNDNGITKSEFEEGLAPATTAVAYGIGQRCRVERIYDRLRRRQVDVSHELLSRNRSRDANPSLS